MGYRPSLLVAVAGVSLCGFGSIPVAAVVPDAVPELVKVDDFAGLVAVLKPFVFFVQGDQVFNLGFEPGDLVTSTIDRACSLVPRSIHLNSPPFFKSRESIGASSRRVAIIVCVFDSVKNFFDGDTVESGQCSRVVIWLASSSFPVGNELATTYPQLHRNLSLSVPSLFSELFKRVHCMHRIHLVYILVNNMFPRAYCEGANA